MSIRKTTERHARAVILSQCRQFIEDTTWDEPGTVWDRRVENLAKMLDAETGADISQKAIADLRELVTTLEEIQSVDAGTHHRIVMNTALTIDNRPDLRDELNQTLRDNIAELLQVAAFRATDDRQVAA
ncbi:hypothetical protein [Pseudarthrobacter cellobiosi]|uniref:hypothetical protein n=1 Tax=Pseudarthrobacter cellobiosi TaxID=2953654 RepID=UPI00208E7B54|nr:hypothetical protein [Pseudarthrobacter sp. HLT1-5]MCO4257353.1 hypothetical protein [Pseudarthrobacter sp. HLT1-5]